jgi:hypothetical protein
MADRTTILRAFNENFFSFLDEIIELFPENYDIMAAKQTFLTIKHANPSTICKIWWNYIYSPYKSIIDNGDIQFFIEKDYGSDLGVLNNSADVINFINKIREPIRNMDENNKNASMKYLQVLSKLSNVYNN